MSIVEIELINNLPAITQEIIEEEGNLESLSSKKKYSAHDENNKFKIGDKVSIVECKPFSKSKKFQVLEDKR